MPTAYLVDGDGYELRLLVLVKQREVDAFVDVYNLKDEGRSGNRWVRGMKESHTLVCQWYPSAQYFLQVVQTPP